MELSSSPTEEEGRHSEEGGLGTQLPFHGAAFASLWVVLFLPFFRWSGATLCGLPSSLLLGAGAACLSPSFWVVVISSFQKTTE